MRPVPWQSITQAAILQLWLCDGGSDKTSSIRPVHEAVRAVVQRQSQDAHVVRVQDPVAEPDTLPLAHEAGRTQDHLPPWVGRSVKVKSLTDIEQLYNSIGQHWPITVGSVSAYVFADMHAPIWRKWCHHAVCPAERAPDSIVYNPLSTIGSMCSLHVPILSQAGWLLARFWNTFNKQWPPNFPFHILY